MGMDPRMQIQMQQQQQQQMMGGGPMGMGMQQPGMGMMGGMGNLWRNLVSSTCQVGWFGWGGN